MTKYKCLIWDWNGTLLDDLQLCVEVMSNMLKERNLPLLTAERYGEIFGFPVKGYYTKLGFNFEEEHFENISEEFISKYQKRSLCANLNEGSILMLAYIKEKGIKQVILSASQIKNLEQQVNHFGISQYFDKLLGLDHCHATSKVEIGREWLSKSGYTNKEVLLVGDTAHDFETAEELGCDCVLYLGGHQSRERILKLGAPVIESLYELEGYLEKL